MIFWRSVETADDIEHAGFFFYDNLIQFLRHIITMSEDSVKCIRNFPAYCKFFFFPIDIHVAMTIYTNLELFMNWNTEL